ncbi:hypothetical protein SAMN06265222_11577 [Neorhodopirellula lusitana]|uniref:Uncharacterized protein n=1 Tax=Neorhodopirellula lusitana TaxID=445327 RepID=A0ABY1QL07_9BACT|nr:hypothetical protein SAMN06265222_11577 [Neorhodopirellula lusitana]
MNPWGGDLPLCRPRHRGNHGRSPSQFRSISLGISSYPIDFSQPEHLAGQVDGMVFVFPWLGVVELMLSTACPPLKSTHFWMAFLLPRVWRIL